MANGCKDVLFARGAAQSDDSDIWDDTALIKAYDKAVASFKTALKGDDEPQTPKNDPPGKKRKNNKKNNSRKKSHSAPDREWQVGERCSAYWSVDGQVYSATISSIDQRKGTCVVLYTDYGNEEEHNLQDLLSDTPEAQGDSNVTYPKTSVNDVESSTEESDRSSSTTPHPHRQHPQSKAHHNKSKSHRETPPPPMWLPGFPGFPPGAPPTMPAFKMGGGRRSGGGPAPPPWPPMMPCGPPMIPPPPPPMSADMEDDEALGSMLISWYMSGYHTGYYLGLKQGRKEGASGKNKSHRSHHK